jgi:hypothetical protein
VCVPGSVGQCHQRADSERREACSRFRGVAWVFHTGTTSTFGREVNWKSIGASVDLSDLRRCAIESRLLADTRPEA